MSTNTTPDAQTIVDVATRAAIPHEVEPGKVYAVVDQSGIVHELNLDRDEYRDHPRRKAGTVNLHDVDSITRYLNKHATDATEVWADVAGTRIAAVLNAPDTDTPGWSDHLAVFTVKSTPAWEAWLKLDGKFVDQTTFAEHIEDRSIDIVTPKAADMLEVAQSITATIGVSFESSKRLSSGEQQLTYKENIDAKAGHRGQLEIPSTIELGLVPFYGAAPYKVIARFRYRIHDGQLRLAFKLERPEDVQRDAFAGLLDDLAEKSKRPILLGWPGRI